VLVGDLERLRNTLLAARQSVLLAAAAGAGESGQNPPVQQNPSVHPLWLAGYEAALVTVAVAFGLECREIAPIALCDNATGVNPHPRLTVQTLDEDGQPELKQDLALTSAHQGYTPYQP